MNITSWSVPLYDPLHPVNTWWIDGGVKYEFPVGTRLAAGEYALVVEFDPVKEPEQAKRWPSATTSRRARPCSARMRGNPSNRGDTVRLYKPDPPQGVNREDAGFVPHILVDRVKFRDSAPGHPRPTAGAPRCSARPARHLAMTRSTGRRMPHPGRDNRRSEGEDPMATASRMRRRPTG